MTGPLRIALIPIVTSIFALALGAATAQSPQVLQRFDDLSEGFGPVSGPTGASNGPERFSIGWCVGEGPAEGVYVRRKADLFWDPSPIPVDGPVGYFPRDLSMVYDPEDTAHLVWTGMDGDFRRLFYCSISDSGAATAPVLLNPEDQSDADYPVVALGADGRLLIVWQEVLFTHFSVQALRLSPTDSSVQRLAPVSGSSQSAMTPQILDAASARVAWYDVLDSTNDLRVAALDDSTGDWPRVGLAGIDPNVPFRYQPLILLDDSGAPTVVWNDEGEFGESSIQIAGPSFPGSEAPPLLTLDRPAGDHRRPHAAYGGGSVTVAWEVFSDWAQSVRLARVHFGLEPIEAINLSPLEHRFASNPWHFSYESTSIVVWSDDYLDGGTGSLGFAEVLWGDE